MKRYWAMKWAKYLEAPGRKQAQSALYDGKGKCCLGHAEAMIGNKFVKVGGNEYVIKGTKEGQLLTHKTAKKLGMKSTTGTGSLYVKNTRMGENQSYESLAEANDDGCTLKDIAAAIRKYWKVL